MVDFSLILVFNICQVLLTHIRSLYDNASNYYNYELKTKDENNEKMN